MGREGLGGKMLPREPAPRLTPEPPKPSNSIPSADMQSPAQRSHRPPTKRSQPEACAAMTNRCHLTTEKRAEQPAEHNKNTPHKVGHMTNMPNDPRTNGAKPAERPVPDAWHCTVATTRQAGQKKTSQNNTEAANKKHPTQNGRPTQMQAPGQHRHMHPPKTNKPKPPGPARQVMTSLRKDQVLEKAAKSRFIGVVVLE
ncbi:hypothetical protein CRENBAI_018564 [Crenichthys baileyi]|uniref:Uncharacterized protein n=1 Tax=Crenichthys baileyi TaxID=28760 RepID=A0AAV9R9S1_9TELE